MRSVTYIRREQTHTESTSRSISRLALSRANFLLTPACGGDPATCINEMWRSVEANLQPVLGEYRRRHRADAALALGARDVHDFQSIHLA